MIGLFKKAIVELPIRLKGNTRRPSGNSLSLLAAHNKDLGAASQKLPTEVKLRLRRRLVNTIYKKKNNTRLSYESASKFYALSVMSSLPFVREVRVLGCVPLGWSGSGSVIRDHLDPGRSNEPMNPCPEWIHRFISSTMIRVISDHWSWSGSSQRNAPLFFPVSMALMRAALDKIATVTSTTRDFKCIERY